MPTENRFVSLLLEPSFKKGYHSLRGRFLVRSFRDDLHGRIVAGSEGYDSHYRFSVDPVVIFFEENLGFELIRGLDNERGGTGMDSRPVFDRYFL